jgi:hypothetical protein
VRTAAAALRRSPLLGLAVVVVVGAVVAGAVLLATRPGQPAPSPTQSTRAVAFGDSVPYGHGLVNPYGTPQLGLLSHDISQGPSTLAYPSLVATQVGLTMQARPSNCPLVDDQLAISGAEAETADNTQPSAQCLTSTERNLGAEIDAAHLGQHPARLVLLQAGADDIHFSQCLEYELARVLGAGIGLGTNCVSNGAVAPQVATELSAVRSSLAAAIERIAPDAATVAVLNYYQPVPPPSQIADDAALSGLGTNLVCSGLKTNASSTAAAAQVVLTALNDAIGGAVADARAHGAHNALLVDVSHAMDGHGICTADPWVFSAESISDATLADDGAKIVAAKACTAAGSVLHSGGACGSLVTSADGAKQSIKDHVWRTAHPTAAGQRAIAVLVEQELRGRA